MKEHGNGKRKKSETRDRKKQNFKQRAKDNEEEIDDESEEETSGLQLQQGKGNRYGIEPLGNLLLNDKTGNIRNVGLGKLCVLSDEILCDIFGLLQAHELASFSLVSKAFYIFSHLDFLWKNLVLNKFGGDFKFKTNWRRTYAEAMVQSSSSSPYVPKVKIKVEGFFSDYLFQSLLCSSLEMKNEWLVVDNIDRRCNLSVEEFVTSYEELNKPVIIMDATGKWPAVKKWNKEYLIEVSKDVKFAVGPINMRMEDYFCYADAANEEQPLYLFDPKFGEKVPKLSEDYEVPAYFKEDLFHILGKERPDYRWLIIGPCRSGSSFHIDPNSTSAWNAVIQGSKKWILFPPDVNPPGVHPSPDGTEVTSPVSIMEWFMNFYKQARFWKKRPVECVCRAGELMFIPYGWWHLVVNLEDSIAITQNYVSRSNLLNVLEFLSHPNSVQLVSGTRDRVNLYSKFKQKYEELFPGSVEVLNRKAEEKAKQKKGVSFWETIMDSKAGGFKFGF